MSNGYIPAVCLKHWVNVFWFCVTGRVEKRSWCTVRWAFLAPGPQWSLTPWSSSAGHWMWRWPTWRIGGLSSNPMRASWSSFRSTAASLMQGQIQSLEKITTVKSSEYNVILNFLISYVPCALVIVASSVTAPSGGESLEIKDRSLYTRRRT